jgi:hypothetical protein
VETLLVIKPHPEAGYRAAMGLRPLVSEYGRERLEAASTRAIRFKLYRLGHVRSILTTQLDQQPLPQLVAPAEPVAHDNIRGSAYYGGDDDTTPARRQEVAG